MDVKKHTITKSLLIMLLSTSCLIQACTMTIINDNRQSSYRGGITLSKTKDGGFFQNMYIGPGQHRVYQQSWLKKGVDLNGDQGDLFYVRAGDITYQVRMTKCFVKPTTGHQKVYLSQIEQMGQKNSAYDPTTNVRMNDYLTVSIVESDE